jgi:hypothetical protein
MLWTQNEKTFVRNYKMQLRVLIKLVTLAWNSLVFAMKCTTRLVVTI